MNINYNRIVTTNLTDLITAERLAEIKTEAKAERSFIKRHGVTAYVKEHLSNKAEEIAYIRKGNHEKTAVEKALLAANIVFDDESFAEILTKGNFTYNSLNTYLKLLTYFKNKKDNSLNEKEVLYQKSIKLFTLSLSKHISKYIGATNPNTIINKINEVISFKPELLINDENTKTK